MNNEWEKELREFAGNIKRQNHIIHHGRALAGEKPQEDEAICVICGMNADKLVEYVSSLLASERADWLRSEIEKLENEKQNNEDNPYYHKFAKLLDGGKAMDDYQRAYNTALTSIITRYKEELKVLTGE